MNYFYYDMLFARLGIGADGEGNEEVITGVVFGEIRFFKGYNRPASRRLSEEGKFSYCEKETPLIARAAAQIKEYFDGKRKEFDLPLKFIYGTDFMKRVWAELLKIPYGQTITYSQIAERAGCPRGARAAGNALNRNPISIVVPCHRVIGTDKTLRGFGGGLELKQKLLDLEKN